MLGRKDMIKNDHRIILDTNLWISFLITKDYSRLDKLLISGSYKLIFSQELLEEFIEVANRPKLKKYFRNSDLAELIDRIEDFADFISVKTKVNICRDKKDNFLLSLAMESNAKYKALTE